MGRGFNSLGDFEQYASQADFPPRGNTHKLYLDLSTESMYYWDGSQYILAAAGSAHNDVIVRDSKNDFPATGDDDKIYVARDTNVDYRWDTGSSSYVALDQAAAQSDVKSFSTKSNFPATGETNILYIAEDTSFDYFWDGSKYVRAGIKRATVQTTDDFTVPLNLLQSPASTNFITDDDTYYHFNLDFVAKNVTDNEISVWNVKFAIANNSGTATLVGSILVNQVEFSTGIDANSVTVSIANSNEVEVNVTGVTGKTIEWAASYYTTKVKG